MVTPSETLTPLMPCSPSFCEPFLFLSAKTTPVMVAFGGSTASPTTGVNGGTTTNPASALVAAVSTNRILFLAQGAKLCSGANLH